MPGNIGPFPSRRRPPPAGAFPTATCSESRGVDGSCSPAGTARGCLILIAAPGDRDVFPPSYFICAPRRCRPPPTPRLRRRGERRWLRGRRHLLGSFAWLGGKIQSTVGAMSTVQVKMELRNSRSNRQLLAEVRQPATKALSMLWFGFVLPSLSSLGDMGIYPS